jgi:5-methylcytosine-specific restriction endonuclease McrA
MKKYICRYPGCNKLLESPGYCEEHIIREKDKPFSGAIRFNEKLYNTTRWRQLRKKILKEPQSCYRCGIDGNETEFEIHHIIPPMGNEELFFDESNLVAVCPVCHKIITNKEIRDRKK